jgi:methylmalonyl-CoA/ethylmalonyl-CoA epimerase
MDKSQTDSIFGSKLHHVGIVVKDLKKAIAYYESIGFGPFRAREDAKTVTIPFKGELNGKPAEWKTTISNGKMGEVELELLEATEGPQALKESLDATGEGLHHIGFLTDDVDAEIAKALKKGMKVWTRARRPDNRTIFCYLAPTEVGKLAIELRLTHP